MLREDLMGLPIGPNVFVNSLIPDTMDGLNITAMVHDGLLKVLYLP
jgi:hypothetical protein